MIWARHLKLFTKLGVAALALGALAASGNAQNVYQGKFTLPAETHWGGATPAGWRLHFCSAIRRVLPTHFTSMERASQRHHHGRFNR